MSSRAVFAGYFSPKRDASSASLDPGDDIASVRARIRAPERSPMRLDLRPAVFELPFSVLKIAALTYRGPPPPVETNPRMFTPQLPEADYGSFAPLILGRPVPGRIKLPEGAPRYSTTPDGGLGHRIDHVADLCAVDESGRMAAAGVMLKTATAGNRVPVRRLEPLSRPFALRSVKLRRPVPIEADWHIATDRATFHIHHHKSYSDRALIDKFSDVLLHLDTRGVSTAVSGRPLSVFIPCGDNHFLEIMPNDPVAAVQGLWCPNGDNAQVDITCVIHYKEGLRNHVSATVNCQITKVLAPPPRGGVSYELILRSLITMWVLTDGTNLMKFNYDMLQIFKRGECTPREYAHIVLRAGGVHPGAAESLYFTEEEGLVATDAPMSPSWHQLSSGIDQDLLVAPAVQAKMIARWHHFCATQLKYTEAKADALLRAMCSHRLRTHGASALCDAHTALQALRMGGDEYYQYFVDPNDVSPDDMMYTISVYTLLTHSTYGKNNESTLRMGAFNMATEIMRRRDLTHPPVTQPMNQPSTVHAHAIGGPYAAFFKGTQDEYTASWQPYCRMSTMIRQKQQSRQVRSAVGIPVPPGVVIDSTAYDVSTLATKVSGALFGLPEKYVVSFDNVIAVIASHQGQLKVNIPGAHVEFGNVALTMQFPIRTLAYFSIQHQGTGASQFKRASPSERAMLTFEAFASQSYELMISELLEETKRLQVLASLPAYVKEVRKPLALLPPRHVSEKEGRP